MIDSYDAVTLERRAKRFWVALIVGLLGIQLTIGYVAVRLAIGDPTVAIVPDYHEAALRWDETRLSLSAADRLGYTTDLQVSEVPDGQGRRAILFSLIDSAGNPPSDVQVTASVYHHARASEVQTFPLALVGDGKFMGTTLMAKEGLWQVNLEVRGAPELIRIARELSLGL